MKRSRLNTEIYLELCFYALILSVMLFFVFKQPFGDPPDEVARYKVVQFICKYLALPTGEEFEVAIGGYGGSYAYQPMLPYIIMGLVTRAAGMFTQNLRALLVIARLVNTVCGLVMAVFVRRMAVCVFDSKLSGWMFTCLVMCLPQNLFLHTYVNTDSMAIMSGAVIIYAALRIRQSGCRTTDCILLAAAVSVCLLSYYNAYGIIVGAVVFLLGVFAGTEKKSEYLRCYILAAVLVLILSGWYFARNYIIYDGDLLGLKARTLNSIRTALPQYNPLYKVTPKSSGESLIHMLVSAEYNPVLWNSFVARFAGMSLYTSAKLYPLYYLLFAGGTVFGAVSVFVKKKSDRLFAASMAVIILITYGLCTYYSYAADFQPQGRYIMPMVIPLMYFAALGVQFFSELCDSATAGFSGRGAGMAGRTVRMLVIIFMVSALVITMVRVVIPYYTVIVPDLWNTEWIYY